MLIFNGDIYTETTDITRIKMLLNSVISTPGAKFLTFDIKNFYPGTPMEIYKYMKIKLDTIPTEIIKRYNLEALAHNNFVYIEIRKGMYGLKQTGVLANKNLENLLNKDGYVKTKHTPGLWRHVTQPITFTLCVDDFGIKYVGKHNTDHLIKALNKHYKAIIVDWEGKKFCGIDLDWDYCNRTCDISMLGYIIAALTKFDHHRPWKKHHSSSIYSLLQYGQKIQFATSRNTTPLTNVEIKQLQQVVGSFLFYSRVCD